MDPKPSIGRVVHYVLSNGPNEGKHRPAFVVEVNEDLVHLNVFTMGPGDGATYAVSPYIAQNIAYSALGMQGTWHWPEREPTPVPASLPTQEEPHS